jgi:mannosyltransferase
MTQSLFRTSAPGTAVADSSRSSAEASTRRALILALTLLTLAGALFRLWRLGAKSLWLDEGATVALARTSWGHFGWVWWHGEASLQTLYFLLMRVWIHGGLSEAWLRLPSAMFGIASIPVAYIVARRLMTEIAAIAAAALLAFSPAHVYYSQEARGYALATLLLLFATYCFVQAVENNRGRDWALWTVLGIAAFYTHDFAALVLAAQAVALLFRRAPVPWRSFLACAAIIFVVALPGLSYVFRAPPVNLHFAWMPRATPTQLWHLAMFFGGSGVKVAFAIVLWVAGITAVFRARRTGSAGDFWLRALIVAWAIVPAVILALISIREPMFLQRYMVFSLPATAMLAGLGADALRRWRMGLLLVVVLCALSVPTIVKQSHKPREDWRGASNLVLASAAPGDAVAFVPFYTRIMLDYYTARYGTATPPLHVFAPGFYSGGESALDLLAVLARDPHQFRHVWVFVSKDDATAYAPANNAELLSKLQLIFGAPSVHRFADIQVLRFGN